MKLLFGKIPVKFYSSALLSQTLVWLLIVSCNSTAVFSQNEPKKVPDGTDGLVLTAPGKDSAGNKPKTQPNEVSTSFSTFKIGLGYIHDYSAYSTDATMDRQMDSAKIDLVPAFKVRDFRVLGSGVLATKRLLAWKFAYMYDGNIDAWLVRETGLTVGLPELFGNLFIGRTKEGFSMIKVMNGHSPPGIERQMALDPIPILADGIKLYGFEPKSRIFWNLGYFNDIISKGQGFSTFEWQAVARIGWMPYYHKEENSLVHLAVNLRHAKPLNETFVVKSRPESNPTPFFINTGNFAAEMSNHFGGEAYYSKGRMNFGSEVMVHNFYSGAHGNHSFFGGNFFVSYMLTKTYRPYNTTGSIYGFVKVNKSVFKGGIGEFEAFLHVSTFNLNNADILGGQFTKITPMLNWYMSRNVRLEFVYAYGILDRYHLKGGINFFQARFQLTVL